MIFSRLAVTLGLLAAASADSLRGGHVDLQHHAALKHHVAKHVVKKASDDDDDDDFDFSKIHFHFHTPSYGNFKMNEPSTVLHELLQKLDQSDFKKVAGTVVQAHNLTLPSKRKVLDELQLSLDGLKSKGHSYLLDGAMADFPSMTEDHARSQFMQLISAVINNGPKEEASLISKPKSVADILARRQQKKNQQKKSQKKGHQQKKASKAASQKHSSDAKAKKPEAAARPIVASKPPPKKRLPKNMKNFMKSIAFSPANKGK